MLAATESRGSVRLNKSTLGIACLRKVIKDTLYELASEGNVSRMSIVQLKNLFGEDPAPDFVEMLEAWFVEETQEGSDKDLDTDGVPTSTAHKKAAVQKELRMTLKDLDRQKRKLGKQEKNACEIARQRLSIPQASGLETIQRYETSIQRGMDRAIDQLERLQRRRRGELPPPTVNVSSNDGD